MHGLRAMDLHARIHVEEQCVYLYAPRESWPLPCPVMFVEQFPEDCLALLRLRARLQCERRP
jgi:hypothetical protein